MDGDDAPGPVTEPGRASVLLTDIIASTTRHDSRDRTEEEVMRLSADPLLLHRYLEKSESRPVIPRPVSMGPVQSNTSWHPLLKTGSSEGIGNRAADYGRRDPIRQPSSGPEPFVATASDVASAIDYHPAARQSAADDRRGSARDRLWLSLLLAGCGVAVSVVVVGLLF